MARARAGQGAEDRPPAPALHGRAHPRLRADRPALLSARFRLTVRHGSRVEHARFEDLEAALDALEGRLDDLRGTARREPARAFSRHIAPVAQVAARVEIGRGARLHAGVDVRGDGSLEAWRGLVRKRVIEARDGEDAVAALRRALT